VHPGDVVDEVGHRPSRTVLDGRVEVALDDLGERCDVLGNARQHPFGGQLGVCHCSTVRSVTDSRVFAE